MHGRHCVSGTSPVASVGLICKSVIATYGNLSVKQALSTEINIE